ncbi:hypothetical protein B296_00056765 [Ensete ventricosum]|uniref:C2H2-type domain-containing protein n=1 Tax=Ensete ventricosum TaxID=4639 RepID=A0A426X1C1_ENSVE|nr:hypothetical protein B296_00056765 [Ensete ventricosum]
MITGPDAEVIALSPRSLLATNRFVCEVCNKGFQREQNLQLHRRGHNLPWKLKQKNPEQVRRRVYVCPEPTCVHHDPSRALGDLTGIKKHFCRKHGEKRWKCDKCSKRYAVQSDWKAHSKICGTREYRCDCGTLFSSFTAFFISIYINVGNQCRRDSFITHRAFCDALAQERATLTTGINSIDSHSYANRGINLGLPPLNSQLSLQDQAYLFTDLVRLRASSGGSTQFDHLNATAFRQPQPPHPSPFYAGGGPNHGFNEDPQFASSSSSAAAAAAGLFNLGFFSNSGGNACVTQSSHLLGPDQYINNAGGVTEPTMLITGNLMGNHIDTYMSSLCNPSMHSEEPLMSATALLQKASQMGATSSGGRRSSMLRGYTGSYSAGTGHASLESPGIHVESENHFQDIMSSLSSGNNGVSGGVNQQVSGFSGFILDSEKMDERKLHHNLSAGGIGGPDRLTRDFLGVGSMMRSMVREQHLDMGMSFMDSEKKTGSSNRSFGGGRLP